MYDFTKKCLFISGVDTRQSIDMDSFNHLAGGALCDLDQLPEDGVVRALQSLDGYLLRHGALLDACLQ